MEENEAIEKLAFGKYIRVLGDSKPRKILDYQYDFSGERDHEVQLKLEGWTGLYTNFKKEEILGIFPKEEVGVLFEYKLKFKSMVSSING